MSQLGLRSRDVWPSHLQTRRGKIKLSMISIFEEENNAHHQPNLENKNLPSGLTLVLEVNSLLACFILFSASLFTVLPNTRIAMSCTSFTDTSFELHDNFQGILTNKMTDKSMQFCGCVSSFTASLTFPTVQSVWR